MGRGIGPTLRRYAIYFALWTAVGLFFFSQGLSRKAYAHDPTPWWHYLMSWLTGTSVCAILTPSVLWLGRRFPIERRNWLRPTAMHLLFGAGYALVQVTFNSAALAPLGIFPLVLGRTFRSTFAVLLVNNFHQNVIAYWTVLCIQHAFRYYGRSLRLQLHASELKTQLIGAQLSALKMQLQPHFLFNTLNANQIPGTGPAWGVCDHARRRRRSAIRSHLSRED
jgi:two-component system, LytTR family, sensor kinase